MESSIQSIDSESFTEHVTTTDCLVVFHKKKCPNCKVMVKVVEKCIAADPDFPAALIDSEENAALAEELEVTRVPSLLVYKSGELKVSKSGILKPAEVQNLFLQA